MNKLKPLDPAIFLSEDVVHLAQFLLNKFLISTIDQKEIVCKIVETEAYRAPEDKASHAYLNKRTERTETMFGQGGISYVYLCYGLHNMLNVVTGPRDVAHAVLIRAVEPVSGLAFIKERRKKASNYNLTNGPGKLGSALGITTKHNALDLTDPSSSIYLADNNKVDDDIIVKSPRVGIAYAEECSLWNWRFRIKDNPWTSLPHKVDYSNKQKKKKQNLR